MKFRSLMTAICVLTAAQIASAAPFAYIANSGNKTVSVIDTAITPNPLAVPPGSNAITATVPLLDDNGAGTLPDPYAYSIAVGASGQYVYVGVQNINEVQIIDTSTNTVLTNKRIYLQTDKPGGLAVNAAETRLYVAVNNSNILKIIDISGSGASEAGRATVSDSAQSVPEGVVLNAAGTKAYVANSADGQDSIAEITLDEVNKIYTRSAIIPLPAGSKPYGLAINGTKLYFSSFNGNAGVVDTTTKVVTSMTTDLGNLSIAVNPVGGKVYAASYARDLLYAFDSAGVALGSYASAAGPRGISLTPPNGAKLFVAMHEDDTVKVFDTTNLATAPVTIKIPDGAKPNSFGNFIGPAWPYPYTITATNGTGCTITPAGSVPVTGHGWTFGISGAGCEVKVNGTSVGVVSSYQITNVTDNTKTIDASPLEVGTYYTLAGDWITSVGGYLVSTPAGINAGSKSAQFLSGTSVSLNAGPGFKATNWTGSCAGTPDGQPCVLLLTANKLFGATIIPAPMGGPIFDGSNYYQTWAACTSGAANYAAIKLSTDIITLPTDGPVGYWYTLSNQWNKNDYSLKGTYTPMTLTITSVGIIANDLTL